MHQASPGALTNERTGLSGDAIGYEFVLFVNNVPDHLIIFEVIFSIPLVFLLNHTDHQGGFLLIEYYYL